MEFLISMYEDYLFKSVSLFYRLVRFLDQGYFFNDNK